MDKTLFISASPRSEGRSAQLTYLLVKARQNLASEESIEVFSLVDHYIDGCIACDECREEFECIIDDDMQMLYPLLDEANELIIVSPVFFAGPPSQLKALLDRMQPYFWEKMRSVPQVKRPARLYVLGEGGDPHGFSPLVGSVRSALAVAGYSLDAVYDCRKLSQAGFEDVARDPEPYRVEGADFDSPTPPGSHGGLRA